MNLDHNRLTALAYYLLLPLAAVFLVLWGLHFGVWWDIGLYAVLVVLVGFGIIGTFVYGHAQE